MGGISMWQLLIILVIVAMVFGTKKLKNMGSDLGGAIKGFKKGLSDEEEAEKQQLEDETEATSSLKEAHSKDSKKK